MNHFKFIYYEPSGNNTGVFVPMTDWDAITQKHKDLKGLINTVLEPSCRKIKLSQLARALSNYTAEALLKYVAESRNECEERLEK